MFYRPLLNNGKFAPLNWTIASFRFLNRVCWPLEDGAPIWLRIFDRCYLILFIGTFTFHHVFEAQYIISHQNYTQGLLRGLTAYLVQLELVLRSLQLAFRKELLKKFLKRFYSEVYNERSLRPECYSRIQSQLRVTFAYSSMYFFVMIIYAIKPIIIIAQNRRDMLFETDYPFDTTPLYIYLPLVYTNVWGGFTNLSLLYGEANIIAEVMLHLNEQYLQLNEELQANSRQLMKEAQSATISRQFMVAIKKVLKKNVTLNDFTMDFQELFNYSIFIMFFCLALLLCILCFWIYTSTSDDVAERVSVFIYMLSKTVEILAVGKIGSTLMNTTDDVSSMYYNSNWELIIAKSTNNQDNVKLMKLLVTTIATNQKPFSLKGLHFFSVSLASVLKILHGAASYFMFLISVH